MTTAAAEGASLGEATGVDALLGVAPKTADFVRAAAMDDLYASEAGELAATRTTGPTRQYATAIVRDRTDAAQALRSLAGAAKVDVPAALDRTHRTAVDKLAHLRGDDFDVAYHTDQAARLAYMVSLFKRYARSGEAAGLKAWASRRLPQLETSLDAAKALDK